MESDPRVQETPAVPAELTGPLPRRARLTAIGIKLVTIFSVLLLGSAVGVVWVYHFALQRQGGQAPNCAIFVMPPLLAAVAEVMILMLLMRQRQLMAQGVPALAVVTKCSRNRNGFSVNYEFRTSEGIMTQGRGWSKSQQENGAKIWVLYMPQNPRRSRPYPLPAFRLVPS